MHISVGNPAIIGSDNGLLPGRHQAIIWTNVGVLLTGHYFSEILIEIHTFSFKKLHLKVSSGKWQPFCLSHNVLTLPGLYIIGLDTALEFTWCHLWQWWSIIEKKTQTDIEQDHLKMDHWRKIPLKISSAIWQSSQSGEIWVNEII